MIIRSIILLNAYLKAVVNALKNYVIEGIWNISEEILKDVQMDMGLSGVIKIEAMSNPTVNYILAWHLMTDYRVEEEIRNNFFTDYYPHKEGYAYYRFTFYDYEHADYNSIEFLSNEARYLIWDGIPVTIAKNEEEWLLDDQFGGNELGWISRAEVRILTALCFSTLRGYNVFQLNGTVDIPEIFVPCNLFDKNNDEDLYDILKIIRIVKKNDLKFKRSFIHDFNFNGNEEQKLLGDLYEKFEISNRLLLRTSLHYIKAGMLFHLGNKYAEEAYANMYFGLEGVLRLIYRKHFGNKNFEIKKIKEKLNEIFGNDYYSEALNEFYIDRIQIVHPEPDFDADWIKVGFYGDFMANFSWVKNLLVYYITGEVIED